MKKLLAILATALLFGSLNTTLRAQDIQLYMTEHELPNLVNCLPAPPDTIGEAFTHDIMRYMWGKAQRLKFPLLYIASCGGENCCYVTDVTLKGSRIVQKIFYTGTDYAGTIDWCLDAENGFIYTYGGRNGDYKLLKKFRLPKLADSDANGEVHLIDADVLDVTRIDSGINIWQGSIVRGRYAYLPDGYKPHELFVHVVDLDQKQIVLSKNVTDLDDEPEGICLKDDYAWVVFNTGDGLRHSRLWRFSLE